jgi:hydrogenase nickel incorporation protein HypA/HybF
VSRIFSACEARWPLVYEEAVYCGRRLNARNAGCCLRARDTQISIVPVISEFDTYHITAMHEQSIVESLLNLALEKARESNARKIISINLVVGDYTGVVDDAVNFYFGFLSKDTIAAGATINFMHVPGQLRCRDCDILFPMQKQTFRCPKCSGNRVEIVGGRELYIEDMVVE